MIRDSSGEMIEEVAPHSDEICPIMSRAESPYALSIRKVEIQQSTEFPKHSAKLCLCVKVSRLATAAVQEKIWKIRDGKQFWAISQTPVEDNSTPLRPKAPPLMLKMVKDYKNLFDKMNIEFGEVNDALAQKW
ncbi:hypothetical protein AVEN_275116-1 [Araneus ventricosus]|uniref:Uncharacterized protein n=1 Tax=Araneus ventricosus TaxID=182803 RepID=A0A4Y2P8Y8_ARAVE|nr:hypothetical protein AVEN_275116-1 [Araneus ventricosus]